MESLSNSPETQPSRTAEPNQESYWREQFACWRESGLSQSEYCQQAQLSRHRFKYWRRKLEPTSLQKRRSKKRDSGFVPVQVRTTSAETGLSLSLPNGMVLRGIDAGNVELVKQLVAQL
jgi:hypothetical protein